MASIKNIDDVLHIINKEYITLKTDEVASNNKLLTCTLERMIQEMKEDSIFKKLYDKPFFGGSYYDDLKVGRPDEFDLDLLLVIPKLCDTSKTRRCECVKLVQSNRPGYFWLKIKECHYSLINKFLRDGYMQTDLVLNWLKGLVTNALNTLSEDFSFITPTYFSESGPALTLRLYGKYGHMDVDLVPSFKFGLADWPESPFRENPTTIRTDFFIVPKKAKGVNLSERFWRPSFQDQERELIARKERLKPSLRLLKKMRNNLGHVSVSSYALKSIVLWNQDIDWNAKLSCTFITLLEKYRDSLASKKIPYYWNRGNNLLQEINPVTLENHHNEISRKFDNMKYVFETNPLFVAKIILKEGTEEYRLFMKEYDTHSPERITFEFDNIRIYPRGENEESMRYGSQHDQSTATASGWRTAGVALGVGAVVAIGLGVVGAFFRNNRSQNN